MQIKTPGFPATYLKILSRMREFMVSIAQDARYNQASGANRHKSASSEMIRKLLLLVSEYRDLIFSRERALSSGFIVGRDARLRALLARRYGEAAFRPWFFREAAS